MSPNSERHQITWKQKQNSIGRETLWKYNPCPNHCSSVIWLHLDLTVKSWIINVGTWHGDLWSPDGRKQQSLTIINQKSTRQEWIILPLHGQSTLIVCRWSGFFQKCNKIFQMRLLSALSLSPVFQHRGHGNSSQRAKPRWTWTKSKQGSYLGHHRRYPGCSGTAETTRSWSEDCGENLETHG